MNDREPYTYLIGWSNLNTYYIGVRYRKGCSPSDFWVKYFTSSVYVTAFRYLYGEPDILRTFEHKTAEQALQCENVLLFYVNAVKDGRYLNRCRAGIEWNGMNSGGNPNPMKGRKLPALWAENVKAGHRTAKYRATRSANAREAIANGTLSLAALQSPEARAKAAEARRGGTWSEHCRITRKRTDQLPETKARRAAGNSRRARQFEWQGKEYTLPELAECLGLSKSTLQMRVRSGVPAEYLHLSKGEWLALKAR